MLFMVFMITTASKGSWQGSQYKGSFFNESGADVSGTVMLDKSSVWEGYVGISAVSPNRLKFQVLKGDITYTYDISSDGTPSIMPLQSGDGEYTFRVMENVTESKYAVLYSDTSWVEIEDQFQPFLRPNDYSDYNEQSDCVALAEQLAEQSEDELDYVSNVFDYVCSHIEYDYEKAATVQSGYLPVPDDTLATGKGICFDYSSLVAAMLRSQGIPAKVIFGYVAPDDTYHAWNMFYTEQTGWITTDYIALSNAWCRLDTTFSASGADGSFVGDENNYSDVYCY